MTKLQISFEQTSSFGRNKVKKPFRVKKKEATITFYSICYLLKFVLLLISQRIGRLRILPFRVDYSSVLRIVGINRVLVHFQNHALGSLGRMITNLEFRYVLHVMQGQKIEQGQVLMEQQELNLCIENLP